MSEPDVTRRVQTRSRCLLRNVPKSRVTLFLSDLTLGVNESVSSSRLDAEAR